MTDWMRRLKSEIRWLRRREVRQFGTYVRYSSPQFDDMAKAHTLDVLAEHMVKMRGRWPLLDSLQLIHHRPLERSEDMYDLIGSFGAKVMVR